MKKVRAAVIVRRQVDKTYFNDVVIIDGYQDEKTRLVVHRSTYQYKNRNTWDISDPISGYKLNNLPYHSKADAVADIPTQYARLEKYRKTQRKMYERFVEWFANWKLTHESIASQVTAQ